MHEQLTIVSCSHDFALCVITGAVPAMKPEATAIADPQDGRWKITLMFDGRRLCIPKFRYSTLQQMTRQ